jgi:hypothetical protein
MGGQLARTIARITESGGSSLPGIGLTFLLPLHAPLRVSHESPQSVATARQPSALGKGPFCLPAALARPLRVADESPQSVATARQPVTRRAVLRL